MTFGLTAFPAPARWNTAGTFAEWSMDQVAVALSKPALWPGGPTVAYGAERLPGWSCARFREDSRFVPDGQTIAQRVVSVHGLALDYIDDPRADIEHLQRWWGAYAFATWTQAWHLREWNERPAGPRWRVIVPLSRPVDVDTATRLGIWARHPRRHAGVIDECSEDACRWFLSPAINPGGYHRLAHRGPTLDPDVALVELEHWQIQDRAERAERALVGTHLSELDEALARRLTDPRVHLSASWPWPGLDELTGPLWPGRVVRLVGAAGEERSGVLMQLALAAARSGVPVLLVVPGSTRAEVAARLVALRDGVPAAVLLADGIEPPVPLSSEGLELLHVWIPGAADRDADQLRRKALATAEAHPQGAPLVLVDGVDGWPREEAVVAALEELTDFATLSAEWPGAAVVYATEEDRPCLANAEVLSRDWMRCTPNAGESDLLLALAAAPASGRREVAVAVLRNRDGARGLVELVYDPRRGGLASPVPSG